MKRRFNDVYEGVFKRCWDSEALADYGTDLSYTYGEFAAKIAELHLLFDMFSIDRGDRIAVLGKNSPHWIVVFFAAITKGAVIVPILDDFNPKDVLHIINHSDSKLFFCDKTFTEKFSIRDTEKLKAVFLLSDFSLSSHVGCDKQSKECRLLDFRFKERYPNGFDRLSLDFVKVAHDDVIVLNYTSGTTSLTKGVMLMSQNIMGNVNFCVDQQGKNLARSLAVLPIAHIYGLVVGVLAHLAYGGKVTMLSKSPSPTILLDACKVVRPTMMAFVPLILEKIYKTKVKPELERPLINNLCKIPFVKSIVYRNIGKKLYDQLGGDGLHQIMIGGAAINKDVEQFLREAKFPFTVLYGLTECAPLISYVDHSEFVLQSVGRVLGSPYATVRIERALPDDEIGEIQTVGEHVMKGYFKDEEATISTFTEDGWLKTGDLGTMDDNGNLFIRGRSKTMLLGPSGENIYPESIESKIMNMPFVSECIVMQNKGFKLVAFVYPDHAMLRSAGITEEQMNRVMANNRRTINDNLAKFENIHRIEIVKEPFAKTPKNTVKRHGLDHLLKTHEKNMELKIVKNKIEQAMQVAKFFRNK